MTDREAMQKALEALELLAKYENQLTKIQVRKPKDGGPIVTMYPHKVATEAAAPLRERLAQPEQEPVGLMESLKEAQPCCGQYETCWRPCTPRGKYLGHREAQRKPLNEEEIQTCRHMIDWTAEWSYIKFARAIEAAHGIKGEA